MFRFFDFSILFSRNWAYDTQRELRLLGDSVVGRSPEKHRRAIESAKLSIRAEQLQVPSSGGQLLRKGQWQSELRALLTAAPKYEGPIRIKTGYAVKPIPCREENFHVVARL